VPRIHLLVSPVLVLAAYEIVKVYINGSTAYFGLGLFSAAHLVLETASFKVQISPMLLKTIAHKWQRQLHLCIAFKNPELLKTQALWSGSWP